ncbi:MAG: hypothetical protein MR522_08000 [Trueperella sp.]|uniref:replication initiator n=1 Tax=Trueperella sp. TaxID=2699835 RepID=UPI0025FE64B3|nr:replication initiator [Trueperella sp.]MCI7306185.1 hypothetical protein [Trueperella sp.]MDY5403878.1 replication initiator [Trueperella sp.]
MSNQDIKPDEARALALRYCAQPRLVKRKDTGEAFWLPCRSRIYADCPRCATAYRRDYGTIFRSGALAGCYPELREGRADYRDITGDQLEDYDFFFMTLTAPSFGATHKVPTAAWEQKHPSRAWRCEGCGEIHTAKDRHLVGVPVDTDSYLYHSAVAWNSAVGSLWNVTRTAIRQRFPGVEYVVVNELQVRGALHLHVILRVQRQQFTEKSSTAIARKLARIARGAGTSARCVYRWEDPETGEAEFRDEPLRHVADGRVVETQKAQWGRRSEVTVIGHGRKEESPEGALSYVSKAVSYTLKSFGNSIPVGERTEFAEHMYRLERAAREVVMPCCANYVEEGAPEHVCHGKRHARLGASAKPLSVSRGWSLTGLTGREALRAHQRIVASQLAEGNAGPGVPSRHGTALAGWISESIASVDAYPNSVLGVDATVYFTGSPLERRLRPPLLREGLAPRVGWRAPHHVPVDDERARPLALPWEWDGLPEHDAGSVGEDTNAKSIDGLLTMLTASGVAKLQAIAA